MDIAKIFGIVALAFFSRPVIQPATASTLTPLYSFASSGDGLAPQAELIEFQGKLYGTTTQGGAADSGTVFEVDPVNGNETVLYSFTRAAPSGGLINVGGKLYGVTKNGGTTGFGTIFTIDPVAGTEVTAYSFAGGADGGNGSGTIFSLDPSSGLKTILYVFGGFGDGGWPISNLITGGGAIYGTTSIGGTANIGTVYKFAP